MHLKNPSTHLKDPSKRLQALAATQSLASHSVTRKTPLAPRSASTMMCDTNG